MLVGGAEKISAEHLARLACPYLRQSTAAQVRNNTESRELQYELKERAIGLGWPAERVRVIDVDSGISADSVALTDREGFRELAGEVALGKVGLILGVEVSRLARDNSAWYGLLDVCALTGTLIADSDRIYDPADYSDRLTLGLKGTIAEAEHHLIKSRLIAGLRHKAAKGELRIKLAPGYDYGPDGKVVMSADEAVREAVANVFHRFFELCSVRQVVLSLREDGLLLPRRRGQGQIEWVAATYTAVHDMLTNPIYAGVYAFGRRQSKRRVGEDGRARISMVPMPREEWQTLIFDHHEAYVSWEQHEQILAQITRNAPRRGEGAAAREGQALLQGLLRCGRCGRRMRSAYSGARSRQGWARRYYCDPREGEIAYNAPDGKECQGLGGRQLDEAVLEEVFRVLEPAAITATAKALSDQEASEAARLRAFELAVERARYEASAPAASLTPASRRTGSWRARSRPTGRRDCARSSAPSQSSPLRFTKPRVAQLRNAHGIPAFAPAPAATSADGELLSVRDAAAELDVTPATIYRWLRDGFIAGQQPTPGAPWRIRLNPDLRAKVAEDAPEGWLSLDNAARALGVVRQTVLHRVHRGELAAVHVRRGKRKGLRIQVKPEHAGLFDTPR